VGLVLETRAIYHGVEYRTAKQENNKYKIYSKEKELKNRNAVKLALAEFSTVKTYTKAIQKKCS
jgi:hypothetical protein